MSTNPQVLVPGKFINVAVGPDSRIYDVNKALICNRSEFFLGACSRDWRAAGEPPIDMTDVDELDFESYISVMMLNTGDALLARDGMKPELGFMRVWVLADFLGDRETANLLIDAYIDQHDAEETIPGRSDVEYAGASQVKSSPLYRLMIDYYVQCEEPDLVNFLDPGVDGEFLQDVAKELLARVKHSVEKSVEKEVDESVKLKKRDDLLWSLTGTTEVAKVQCKYHLHHADWCPPCVWPEGMRVMKTCIRTMMTWKSECVSVVWLGATIR